MSSSKWFKAALSVLGVLAVVAYATPAAAQQTGTVTGVVTETGTGRPLQGVQVFVSGRGPTATTDAEGRFTLRNVPTGQTQVRARLVGYTSQSATMAIVAGQSSEVNFEMRASVISLDEIVVTGAGVAQSKKQLGNTVATVNPSELVQTAPVQTFSETLAAREPGISVKPSGGIAGESARIEIRGVSSLSMRNIPVVYVDGVRIDNGRSMYIAASGGGGRARAFDNINPEAIERIEVLKGAAAATLYGSEANAGVIQIFTKKGSAGAPRFNFNMQQGFSQVDKGRIKPNTGFARTATQLTNMREIFNAPNLQLYETLEATTLPDLYGTGYNSAYSGDVAGGSDDFQYFVAGRYTWDDGPMLETLGPGGRDQVRRIQGSAQFTMFPRDRLSFRLSTQFTDMHQNSPPNNNNIYGYISTAIMGKPERANCDESGYVDAYGECSGAGNPYGSAAFNTIREAAQRFIEGDMEHFNTSATITYEATEGLNLDMTFGLDATNQVNFDFTPFGNDVDKVSGRIPTGERWAGNMNNREITIDTRGTWTRRFGNISSQFVAGLQTNLSNNRRRFGFGEDFPGPGLEVVSAAATTDGNEATTETANIGVLLQEQIGFNDWIYVTLGGRWDRNSAFGDSTSGAFYPKVSASIIPSDNGTWSNQTFSSLRLRAAFGKSGQQPSGFAKFTTFSSLSSPDGGGIAPSNLGNVNLKPETAVEWEVGGEVGLFNDQASVDLTYWNRQTQDALVALQFPVSGGFLSPQLDNIGLLSASGLEIKLQARMLDQENL
ncbi:MAG: SusC/RagA family TonB-linked outer membrane protein, partial [Gemmatimonadota bacterium]|nr:SusC/RagA family TonB-linked outer membrane protein [Gemmatimonadota bacterium]